MSKRYRITSRYRFTIFMTVLILCMITITGTLFGFNTANSSSRELYHVVQIESGDTLWDIAAAYGPTSADARRIVQEICDLNEIHADQLESGQKIIVPVYE